MNKKEMKELRKALDEITKGLDLEGLLSKIKEEFKPEFKILIESNEDGEGCTIEVNGTKPSLMCAISELVDALLTNSNLTKKDIQYAVDVAFKENEEE